LNKLTHIKYLAKRSYYKNLIKENQGNFYRTWSVIISDLIDYKSKKHIKISKLPTTMKANDHIYETNSLETNCAIIFQTEEQNESMSQKTRFTTTS